MLEKYSQGEISQAGLIDDEKRDNSLVILAFPTNDFHQEPGTNEEIEDTVKQLLGEQYDNENFVLFHKVCFALIE
jgi:glutathione peroxidase-family protein